MNKLTRKLLSGLLSVSMLLAAIPAVLPVFCAVGDFFTFINSRFVLRFFVLGSLVSAVGVSTAANSRRGDRRRRKYCQQIKLFHNLSM